METADGFVRLQVCCSVARRKENKTGSKCRNVKGGRFGVVGARLQAQHAREGVERRRGEGERTRRRRKQQRASHHPAVDQAVASPGTSKRESRPVGGGKRCMHLRRQFPPWNNLCSLSHGHTDARADAAHAGARAATARQRFQVRAGSRRAHERSARKKDIEGGKEETCATAARETRLLG
jgi:hypothetical protein